MRKLKYLFALIGIGIILFSSGCKKDEPALTEQQEAARLLEGTWSNAQVISAPVTGATGTLTNLVITFNVNDDLTPSTFNAIGAPEYFSSSTTWQWENVTTSTAVLVNGSSPVTYFSIDQLSATNLVITFQLNGPVGGRVDGIGEYTVGFTKQ